jgi:hypothetical protein
MAGSAAELHFKQKPSFTALQVGPSAWFDLDSGFNCGNVHKIREY